VHELLSGLPSEAFVLDLGCCQGSFAKDTTSATIVRFDLDAPRRTDGVCFVRGDAGKLPFPDCSFAAIIANHSLEHFDHLESALREIRRVLAPGGGLFVSVPDASTLTDRLYRWLASGGGHVNAFTSAKEVASTIERLTGLRHVRTRTLYSSLSFLNSRNSPRPRPRRLFALGGGSEWSLFLYVWASRRIDRTFNLRTSIYGWAFYFGDVPAPIDSEAMENVCIRCGQGIPKSVLERGGNVRAIKWGLRVYACPACGALNPFVDRGLACQTSTSATTERGPTR
jgi:SAM-dependent methyltransferase